MANLVTYNQSPFNKSRKDKFLLVLNLPDALKTITKDVVRSNTGIVKNSLEFSVYGAVVPKIVIPEVNLRYNGQNLAVSSKTRPPYDPVTVNFTVDNRFNNYWTIYQWLNLINNDQTGIYDPENLTLDSTTQRALNLSDIGSNLEYTANISLFALDEYDKRVAEFLYTKAFPTGLGNIDYNYRDADEVETYFTFSFSQLIMKLVENVDTL